MTRAQSRGSVLIRLPNWIGDGVMAAPAVQGLGRALPNWDWHLLGNRRSLPLYEGLGPPFHLLPELPRSCSRPVPMWRTALQLRRIGFSAALVLPPSFSSAMLAALAGIPLRVGRRSDGRGYLLNAALLPGERTRHLREQYAEVAAALLDRIEPRSAPWSIPSETRRLPLLAHEIEWADRWYEEAGLDPARTIFMAPGATFGPTKRWPAAHFASLGRGLVGEGWNIVVIGGADEEAHASDLASALRGSIRDGGGAISTAGSLSIRESMSLMAQGRGTISNDSGAMHLAQAAGCPVVGIFGSTSPVWTGPGGARQRVLYSALACSPCFSSLCPTRIECLSEITPEGVRSALDDLLEASAEAVGRPAVFLDRDGTLLEPVAYLNSTDQVRLAAGAGKALRRLQAAGFPLVVATNQSAVARGLLDLDGLRSIHLRMEDLLRKESIELAGIEFCPHYPEITGRCACRKPLPGMLRRAAHSLDLDLKRSFLIGDNGSDIAAGKRAGTRTILVRTGYGRQVEEALTLRGTTEGEGGEALPRPDAVADNLESAVEWILSGASSS